MFEANSGWDIKFTDQHIGCQHITQLEVFSQHGLVDLCRTFVHENETNLSMSDMLHVLLFILLELGFRFFRFLIDHLVVLLTEPWKYIHVS